MICRIVQDSDFEESVQGGLAQRNPPILAAITMRRNTLRYCAYQI